MTSNTKDSKIKIVSLLLTVIMLAVSLVNSGYAWLEITRTPIVSDLELTVMSESGLEIALDDNGSPGIWGSSLDLSSILQDIVPLRPVTYSKENMALYATLYDLDGRNTGKTVALTDAVNANVKATGNPAVDNNGYYIAVTFWVRGAQNCVVHLTDAKEVKEGVAGSGTYVIGRPLWDEESQQHINGGKGLETALRIGFRCQTTDSNGRPLEDPHMVVFEPNCNTHVSAEEGYVDSPSIDGGSLVESADLIRQTASTWDETSPVLSNEVIYSLGEFENNPGLFKLRRGEMEKVTVYIWLEGRDIDCINVASAVETTILARLQLTGNERAYDEGITRD